MLDKKQMAKMTTFLKKLDEDKGVFVNKWKDISSFMGIQTGTWSDDTTDESASPFNSTEVYDNTPKESLDSFCNGLEGYAFGRTISWFNYGQEKDSTPVGDDVKKLFSNTKKHNYKVLDNSNFYDEARLTLISVASFGTAVMWFEEDSDEGMPFFKTLHNKDIYPSANRRGNVDTIIRKIRLTKEDAIEQFGEESLSETIKNSKDTSKLFIFYQYVAPSKKFKFGEGIEGDGKYVSIFWEEGKQKSCKEERYQEKPFICWRWERPFMETAWATSCPSINQHSNFKTVNSLSKDLILLSQYKARGLWLKTKGLKVNFKPSGVTDINSGEDVKRIEALGDLQESFQLREMLDKDIKSAFFVDFFLAMTQNVDKIKTATEVAGLQDEKSAIMSSFFSRMESEFLEPLHKWLFWNELTNYRVKDYNTLEKLTEIKKSMNGVFAVDFISPLFLIQKRRTELEPLDQLVAKILSMATAGFGEAIFKIDIMAYIDKSAECLAVDAGDVIISTSRAEKKYKEQQAALAKQAQEDRQLAQIDSASGSADKLASAQQKGLR